MNVIDFKFNLVMIVCIVILVSCLTLFHLHAYLAQLVMSHHLMVDAHPDDVNECERFHIQLGNDFVYCDLGFMPNDNTTSSCIPCPLVTLHHLMVGAHLVF